MNYFTDLLNEIKFNSTRKEKISQFKGVLSEGLKIYNTKCENVMERFNGREQTKEGIKQQACQLVQEVSRVKRTQAELSEMDQVAQEQMAKQEKVEAATQRDAARLQGALAKVQSRKAVLAKRADAALQHFRCKVRLYRDLTGVCWDYNATMDRHSIQGYVQNKKSCRLKSFSLQSASVLQPLESSTLLWRTLGEVSK